MGVNLLVLHTELNVLKNLFKFDMFPYSICLFLFDSVSFLIHFPIRSFSLSSCHLFSIPLFFKLPCFPFHSPLRFLFPLSFLFLFLFMVVFMRVSFILFHVTTTFLIPILFPYAFFFIYFHFHFLFNFFSFSFSMLLFSFINFHSLY